MTAYKKQNLEDLFPLEDDEIGVLIRYNTVTGNYALHVSDMIITPDLMEKILRYGISLWEEKYENMYKKLDEKMNNIKELN